MSLARRTASSSSVLAQDLGRSCVYSGSKVRVGGGLLGLPAPSQCPGRGDDRGDLHAAGEPGWFLAPPPPAPPP